MQSFGPDLENVRQLFVANSLLFILPEHLGPIASGRRFDDELVHLVHTYGLDSNDALILMEAQRFGVSDIATLDADMRRASTNFNLYTWL